MSFLTISCRREIDLFFSPFKRAFNASENRNSTSGVSLDLNIGKNLKMVTPKKIDYNNNKFNLHFLDTLSRLQQHYVDHLILLLNFLFYSEDFCSELLRI